MPGAVLQRHGEDVRDGVVERLARGIRIVLLRVVRTRADDVVGVVRRVQGDRLDALGVVEDDRVLVVQLAGEVDPRLRLVLGRVLLRVRVEDGALGLALVGDRHLVGGIRAVEEPRDHAVLALVDRHGARLAAHRAVDRLDGHLARERGSVRLPRGDLALARLARGRGGVQRLADGLEDRLLVEPEQRADAGGRRRAEVRDVVDLVLVEGDRLHEVDLDLVAGGDAAHDVAAGESARGGEVLGDRDDRRDVVAGVRVLRGEERVVEVELAHGHAVRPGRPLGRRAAGGIRAEHGGAVAADRDGVRQRLAACRDDGLAGEGGRRDGRVVDHAVHDHVDHVVVELDGVGRDPGQLPGELAFAGQVLVTPVGAQVVGLHGPTLSNRSSGCRERHRFAAGACRARRSVPCRRGRLRRPRNRARRGRAPARRSRAPRARGRRRRAWRGSTSARGPCR